MSSKFERNSTYAGLSSVYEKDDSQQLSLCTAHGSAPQATLTFPKHTAIGIRDALTSVLYHMRKRFSYRPDPKLSPSIIESFEKLGQSYDESTAMQDHQGLLDFISTHDPESFIQPDASVTVGSDEVLWEIFDKKSTMSATLHLKNGFKKGSDWTEGSSTIDTTIALLNSLEKVHGENFSISIGQQPDLAEGYKSNGSYTKKETIPLYWPRTWLQLQAYFSEDFPVLELNKMEAYNLIRFLRLNKTAPSRRSLTLQFESGTHPTIIVEPFGKRFQCQSEVYEGKSFQVQTWETDFLWMFEPLLPSIQSLRVQVRGTALPVIWEADCGDFTLMISDLGYSPANWSKGIEMDIQSPRFDLSSRNDLRAELQNGTVHYNPFTKQKIQRTLFPHLDMSSIVYRNAQEEKAQSFVFTPPEGMEVEYSHINQSLMNVKSFIKGTSDLSVLEKIVNSIKDLLAGLQTQSQLDLSKIKRAYRMFSDVVTTCSEIIRRDRSSIDRYLQFKTQKGLKNTDLDHEVAEELWTYLYGKTEKRGTVVVQGVLEKLAVQTNITKDLLIHLFQTPIAINIEGTSQYDAIHISSAIDRLLEACAKNEQESNRILGARYVEVHKKINLDESIDFVNCVVQDAGVDFSPQFTYSKEKGLQRPSCTCTRTNNEICCHMMALWLQHCIDTQALKKAQSIETSLITHQKANYIKLTSDGDVMFSVEQKYRKLIVNRGANKTTRIFS
ncbi:MAG: hypothetical protein CL916_11380 [Deltaproteobacteria bacterium]|nr:hypothetical protein [Deltaproteobacteria bacterium]